jgi:type VI secretion system Hcp family effector
MPLHAFLDSSVTGTGTQQGREGKTPVNAFNHHAAPDANQVFVIRKKIDASTPAYHDAMTAKTVFSKWNLELWHMPRSGPECNYVTITLEGATIAWISQVMPDLYTPEFANLHEYEEIAFSFTKSNYVKKSEPK